jgi:gliding motility-associated protein GldE
LEADDPFQYLTLLDSIIVNSPTSVVIVGFVILGIMLIFSAFISGSEVAFFSLTPSNIDTLSNDRSKRASHVLRLTGMPEKLLGTILVANNFINVGIVMLSAYLSNELFDFSGSPILGFVLEVVVITFILLLFGEILPKVYATRSGLPFALFMATPLLFLEKMFRPISIILIKSTSLIKKLDSRSQISKGELTEAISLASGENKDDEKILKGIVKFGNIYAREIMQPRIDVTAIDIKTPFKDVIPFIIESGFSRIPVYRGSFDSVEGILYVKDLLPHFHKPNSFNWQSLIRPPYYVPETKKINDLLEEFQTKKIHMAVVIDEYGGTSGIITLEDILEEIMGEIPDESGNDDISYEQIGENLYIFEGKTQLNDFFKVLEIEDNPFEQVRGESDTLAGLILEITGEIPASGYSVEYNKFIFTIEAADKRRIKKIKVEFLPAK